MHRRTPPLLAITIIEFSRWETLLDAKARVHALAHEKRNVWVAY